ncbi:MAG: hypothetical protein AABZ64_16790 [Nitrospinota bacterium]
MPIGADVTAQYTEEAVGGGHPTKARVVGRDFIVEHHVDGRHNLDKLPIHCAGYLEISSATVLIFRPAVNSGAWLNGLAAHGSLCPFKDGSGRRYGLAIPAAGVTIDTTGLSANTLYWVYARDNAGAVALELSTTGFALDNQGFPTKSGDVTRTLAGVAVTNGSTQFSNATDINVRSFWNRVRKHHERAATGSTASVTWVSLLDTRAVSFGAADEMFARWAGSFDGNTAGQSTSAGLDLNSSLVGTANSADTTCQYTPSTGGNRTCLFVERRYAQAAGTFNVNNILVVSGGTGTISFAKLRIEYEG